jgi:hypothetical protein
MRFFAGFVGVFSARTLAYLRSGPRLDALSPGVLTSMGYIIPFGFVVGQRYGHCKVKLV